MAGEPEGEEVPKIDNVQFPIDEGRKVGEIKNFRGAGRQQGGGKRQIGPRVKRFKKVANKLQGAEEGSVMSRKGNFNAT